MMLLRSVLLFGLLILTHINKAQCFLTVETVHNEFFICPGGSTALGVSVSGGTPPFTYSWSPSKGLSSTVAANPVCNVPGMYEVTVTDKTGCKGNAIVLCQVYPVNPVNLGPDIKICKGDTVRFFSFDPGTHQSTSWTPAVGVKNPTVLNPLIVPLQTTQYVLKVQDEHQCITSDTINITVNPVPSISNVPSEVAADSKDNFQLKSIGITGGTSPYTFLWNGISYPLISAGNQLYNVAPVIPSDKVQVITINVRDRNECDAIGKITIKLK